MIAPQYVWFVWSMILLGIWGVVYALLDHSRRHEMLLVSLVTSLFGLTEPIFVPAYWNPPSLFNLAHRTGFDIESIIFTFGVAGIASVIYELVFPVRHVHIPESERHSYKHRLHFWTIISTPVIFFVLILIAPINPIYSFFVATGIGGTLALYCRPDLKLKMLTSAFLFTVIYFLYFLTLLAIAPGYVQVVWDLKAISGILILGIPLEEYIFAFCIGLIWSSIYEHIMWYRLKKQ